MNELKNVIEIASEILDLDAVLLNEESSQDSIAGWDSVGTVILISEIEARHDIEFEVSEIVEFKTIGDISRMLATKIAEKKA